MEKGELIARGRTADVYEYGAGRVLKLLDADRSAGAIEYEIRIAGIVRAAGLPAPAYYGSVVEDRRTGLIYARVAGLSLGEVLPRQPWRAVGLARRFADLQARIHAHPAPDLPSWRERLRDNIAAAPRLTGGEKAAILRRLDGLPDGVSACHGDYHFENVLLSGRRMLAIDWIDAAHADPLFDVGRTLLLFRTAIDVNRPVEVALVRLFTAVYLRRYAMRRPFSMALLERCLLPLAAARLSEGISDQEERLLALIRARL